MNDFMLTGVSGRERLAPMLRGMTTVAVGALAPALFLGGCINVKAPDKPIVINLNINITQEVVYRLDSEAKSVIQQNGSIF